MSLKKYFQSRAGVIGATAGLAVASTLGASNPEDFEPETSVEMPVDPSEIAEKPIPLEQLGFEYAKLEQLKSINRIIGSSRGQFKQLLKFIWQAGPNMARGTIKSKLAGEPQTDFAEVEKMGIDLKGFTPLVDLGSFDLTKLRNNQLDYGKLEKTGIKEIVLMEDRDPMFFLNYNGFDPNQAVPLNRHGTNQDKWTMADLKKLSEDLHRHNIKLVIGFWGNAGNKDKNPFLKSNWEELQPVIPTSDDINPLSFIKTSDGRVMPFAEYILEQYGKLKRDFNLDGLFLGDGLMGYRSFLDLNGPYFSGEYAHLWTDFYKRIYQGIKAISPKDSLWAYDCLGKGKTSALQNGLHLSQIAKYVDHYIFQSYADDAWGSGYMNLPGYTHQRDLSHLASLPDQLKAKTKYTIGFGDKVEGWRGSPESIQQKNRDLAPYARQGTLGVWSTGLFQKEI